MTIAVGDVFPTLTLMTMGPEGPREISTDELKHGTVVLFAVPGAFTPTCSAQHLPGVIRNAAAMREKGATAIYCTAVNDVFVLDAWIKGSGADEDVAMLADGSAALVHALGLEFDLSARGLGLRSQRYAMILKEGVVSFLGVEQPGGFDVSRGENILAHL